VRRALIVYLVSSSSQTSPPCLASCRRGGKHACLGETSKAFTVANIVDDGDGSFVIEDAVNTASRCPTPHQPLFHRSQLNSCLFVHLTLSARTWAASWVWRSGIKR
jgi:hypothetical protein